MRKINLMFGLCLAFLFMGCENKLEMTLPQGPEGPQGEPGMSAYEYWKILNNLPGATADDFYESMLQSEKMVIGILMVRIRTNHLKVRML